jgi:hypothetical protein
MNEYTMRPSRWREEEEIASFTRFLVGSAILTIFITITYAITH